MKGASSECECPHRTKATSCSMMMEAVSVPPCMTPTNTSTRLHHCPASHLDDHSDSDDTFFVPRPLRRAPRHNSRRPQHTGSSSVRGQQIEIRSMVLTSTNTSHAWSDEFCDVSLENIGENSDDDKKKCHEKNDARTKGKVQRNIRNIANKIKTNSNKVNKDKDVVEFGCDFFSNHHVDLPPFEGGGNSKGISTLEYTSSGYVDGKDYHAFDPGGGGGLVSCISGTRGVRLPSGGIFYNDSNGPKPPPLAPSSPPPPYYCAFSSLMYAADDTTYGDSDTTVALSDIDRQVRVLFSVS